MNVLMTADTVGGVWTYTLELVRALNCFPVEVALATMGRRLSRSQAHEAAQISRLHVFESDFKLEWMESPWDDVERAGDWLVELARITQPDVVHLNNYAHGALDWQKPLLIVGHSCVLSWWQGVKKEEAPASWDSYRARVSAGLRRADVVVAPTQWMLNTLEHYYGPFSARYTIANGQSGGSFAPARKENLILTVGRLWDVAKNITPLESIAPALPWPVYVAGETTHPDGGERTLRHLQPLGQLDRSELASWMGRAAIYVLPARYEPFGLSALEAALSGCTLVLGDIPSLREVWEDAAIYVSPDDAEELRETLTRLIAEPSRREEMGRRAHHRAQRFSANRMGMKYWQVYRRLHRAHTEQTALSVQATPVANRY